jgi:hypothetical protein
MAVFYRDTSRWRAPGARIASSIVIRRARTGLQALVRRRTVGAAAIYFVLSCLMFAPGAVPGRTLSTSDALWSAAPWEHIRPAHVPVRGSNPERGDATSVFEPFLQHTRAVLPDVPLWNPHIMGGRPFLANPQSAVFSPFSMPAYVLPFRDSLALIAALKLFVAALGAFLLGRAFGMRFGGALLAGLVFGFSLWSVTWVSWTTMSVWAYVPWLCVLSELCVRRPGPLPFVGLAAVVGLQFVGGHPSSSFQVLAVVAAFWAVRAVAISAPRRDVGVRLLTLVSALLAGTALAAVVLIPFVEVLDRSYDLQARTANDAEGGHQPGRYLLGVFLHDWWGRGSRTNLEFAASLEEHAYYVGVLPLLLVAAALVLRPRRERLVVGGVGAVMLAVSTGAPVLFDLVNSLPGFSASTNGRLAVITVLCVALLAGWGLDDLATPWGAARRRAAVVGVALAIIVLPLAVAVAGRNVHREALDEAVRVAWTFTTPTPELASLEGGELADIIRLASLLEWLGLAAASVALLVMRTRGRLGATGFTVLAVVLVALDLFKAGMGFNPAIDERDAEPPTTAAVRFLQARAHVGFAGLSPLAPFSFAPPLPANQAMRYGLYDARGYDIPVEERYARMWQRAVSPNPGCNYALCPNVAGSTPRALGALGVLGVRYLLQAPRDPPLPHLRMAYSGPDARLYENPRALPRAFLVGRQLAVGSGEEALAAITSPRFPGRTVAITEERLPGLSTWPSGEDRGAGEAAVTIDEAERTVVQTAAPRPALLVLTDSWDPGWKATVDGRDTPLRRVDYLIRGVGVPAGSHRVELRYRPTSWRAGWIVSSLALVLIVAAAVIGARRNAQRRGCAK